MTSRLKWTAAFVFLGFLVVITKAQTQTGVSTQTRSASPHPVMITRLFTGPDGLTHAEDIEAKFDAKDIYRMVQINGGELHRYSPGYVNDWHPAPRRQYVITLSGRGEVELAGGKKLALTPGHIELAEDTTGKGHITRVIGNEDRVTIQLPVDPAAPR